MRSTCANKPLHITEARGRCLGWGGGGGKGLCASWSLWVVRGGSALPCAATGPVARTVAAGGCLRQQCTRSGRGGMSALECTAAAGGGVHANRVGGWGPSEGECTRSDGWGMVMSVCHGCWMETPGICAE